MANKSRETANLVSNAGVSTIRSEVDIINGPVVIGTATSTGTASQRLQVTGGAYVSGNLGIGTTNPAYQTHLYSPATTGGNTLYLQSEANATLLIDSKSSAAPYSSDIRFARSGSSKWILGSSYIGSLSGIDDFTLFGGLSNYYPFTAQYSTGNIGIGITNPQQVVHVGSASSQSFVITGIGSVGLGITNPTGRLQVVSYQPYNATPKKLIIASSYDTANPLGSNVLTLFGGAESIGGAIGFNVEDILIPATINIPPDGPVGGALSVSQNYMNRACGLLTFGNVSTAGKSPNGTSFNIYGGAGLGYGNSPNSRTLTHYAMLDGNGNVGIGTTLSGAEVAFHRPRIVLAVDRTATTIPEGSSAGCFVKAQSTSCPSTSTTYDVFRFLNKAGNLTGAGFMSGWLMINIVSVSSGAHQSCYMYTILSTGNGTTDGNYTLAYSQIRGTNPISSIAIANDGGTGAIKLQITTGANGTISPCRAYAWFIGQGSSGMFDTSSSM